MKKIPGGPLATTFQYIKKPFSFLTTQKITAPAVSHCLILISTLLCCSRRVYSTLKAMVAITTKQKKQKKKYFCLILAFTLK